MDDDHCCPNAVDCLNARGWHVIWTGNKEILDNEVIILERRPVIIADADLGGPRLCRLVRDVVLSRQPRIA